MYKKGLRRLLRTASSYSLMAILSLQMVSNSTIVVQAKTQNPVEQSVQKEAAAGKEVTVTTTNERGLKG